MLNDVIVVCVAVSLWSALGYPVARKLGPSLVWPALAAPPLGLAIMSTLMVILYASGLRLDTAFRISLGIAAPGIVLAARDGFRLRWTRAHGAFLIVLLVATLLVLLPKWLGPPEFWVFQANYGDQLNYLSMASAASRYDYAAIQSMDLETVYTISIGGIGITLRPGVSLLLGGFASAVGQPVLPAAYAYLGALQLCMLFASTFMLRNVVGLSVGLSIFLALGLSTGFSLQYALDVNAWSAFASLSLVMLYAGLLILGLATTTPDAARSAIGNVQFFCSMLVCMAGFWFIYPEILSLIGAISGPVVLYGFFAVRDRVYFLRRLLLVILAGGCALALCAFAWPMTIGFVLQQTHVLTHAALYEASAAYFQDYLFGYGDVPKNAGELIVLWHQSLVDFLSGSLFMVTSVLTGILGVYFLQPSDGSFALRIVWRLGLLVALGSLVGAWIWGLRSAESDPPHIRRALFAAMLGGLLMLGGFCLAGKSYATMKGLTWLSPLLILALVGSVLANKQSPNLVKLVAVIYVGIQISFGGYRSYAAAHSTYGVHYRSPYPLDSAMKSRYRWDYAGLQAAVRGCSRVRVDLPDPGYLSYHELFVKMTLNDIGIRWWSQHPVWGSRGARDKQIDNPDCMVTTEARSIRSGYRVVWLRRDDSVLRFYQGETDRLMLIPTRPPGLEIEGLAADDWSNGNGHAVFRIPRNPKAPASRLVLAIDASRLPVDVRVAVRVNGRSVVDDVASLSVDRPIWSTAVALPDFGEDTSLNVEIDSSTAGDSDTRPLRVRLRALSLER
jgi:hypothetical protein